MGVNEDDNVESSSSKLGHRQLNDKKQLRIPDKALQELEAEAGDSIGFKNCEDDDAIKMTLVEVDY